MNVQVLGDDIAYGAESFWGSAIKTITNVAKSDTAKTIAGTAFNVIGEKLTPTQKAQLANAQVAAGIPLVPYNNSQPVGKDSSTPKDNTSYFIVGGAVLLAAMFMFATMKR